MGQGMPHRAARVAVEEERCMTTVLGCTHGGSSVQDERGRHKQNIPKHSLRLVMQESPSDMRV